MGWKQNPILNGFLDIDLHSISWTAERPRRLESADWPHEDPSQRTRVHMFLLYDMLQNITWHEPPYVGRYRRAGVYKCMFAWIRWWKK